MLISILDSKLSNYKYIITIKNNNIIIYFKFCRGKEHDAGILRMSGLLDALEQHSNKPNGDPLCIYGDPAHPLRRHLQAPYQNGNMTAEQTEFNRSMSSVRVAVEWVFGNIINYYKFLDFKKNLKIGLSAVGKIYTVCTLLRNARTCLYGTSMKKIGRIFVRHT